MCRGFFCGNGAFDMPRTYGSKSTYLGMRQLATGATSGIIGKMAQSKQSKNTAHKPTVSLVLKLDEPITKKLLATYLKECLLGTSSNDWLTRHLMYVRVRSIDMD